MASEKKKERRFKKRMLILGILLLLPILISLIVGFTGLTYAWGAKQIVDDQRITASLLENGDLRVTAISISISIKKDFLLSQIFPSMMKIPEKNTPSSKMSTQTTTIPEKIPATYTTREAAMKSGGIFLLFVKARGR